MNNKHLFSYEMNNEFFGLILSHEKIVTIGFHSVKSFKNRNQL